MILLLADLHQLGPLFLLTQVADLLQVILVSASARHLGKALACVGKTGCIEW